MKLNVKHHLVGHILMLQINKKLSRNKFISKYQWQLLTMLIRKIKTATRSTENNLRKFTYFSDLRGKTQN